MFKYLGKFLGWIFKIVPKYGKFFGIGFAGLYVVSQFIIDWIAKGFPFALAMAAKTVFASELIINQNTHLAIDASPLYTYHEFFGIVVSVLIMWSIIKWTATGIRVLTGANVSVGQYVVGVFILAMMSIISGILIDGQMGFVPIRDSIFFLFKNINPVLQNVIWI